MDVPPGAPEGRNLPDDVPADVPVGGAVGGVAHGVQAQGPTGMQRARQMIPLGDEDDLWYLEDVAGAIAGVVGAPPRVIQHDGLPGDTALQRVLHHPRRLVVLDDAIVAAEEQQLHPPLFVEFDGGIQAVTEDVAQGPAGPVTGAEDEGHGALRGQRRRLVDLRSIAAGHRPRRPAGQHQGQRYSREERVADPLTNAPGNPLPTAAKFHGCTSLTTASTISPSVPHTSHTASTRRRR